MPEIIPTITIGRVARHPWLNHPPIELEVVLIGITDAE